MRTRFRYAGIRVRDLDRSLAFCTGVLGMKAARRGRMPHGGRYVHLRTRGSRQTLELNSYSRGSRFHTPYRRGEKMDHLAFAVDDARKPFGELRRRGVAAAIDPAHSEGTEVYVTDPDGSWIGLLQEPGLRRS